LAATLALMVLLGLGGVILRASTAGRREQRAAEEVLRAAYLAESGVHDGIANLIAGATNDIGSANQPAAFGGGSYWVDVVDNLDGTFELTSRASDGRQRMAVQAVVRPPVDDPLPGAVFAGNSSGDPLYALEFSGTAPRNDEITGAVYSGADVSIQDDATVNGAITAGGAIYGGAGQSGTTKPSPDIAGMQYDTNHDVDVASDFAAATLQLSPATGGFAWQLPQAKEAHIFRKNPLDRAVHTVLTSKDDYFLEDPYEPLGPDLLRDGSNASNITLSGVDGAPGPDGNELVYYIDGNLWVMNLLTNSFKLFTAQNPGFRVTFAVRGNIYIGDNVYYGDAADDGVAFVALRDPAEPDSGNIYLGDLLDGSVAPVVGSLSHLDGFLYAENDVLDRNLDHLGLGQVEINGHVSAGNQVIFERDLLVLRSKLEVTHDGRLAAGALALPNLPLAAPDPASCAILSWSQIPYP